MRNFVKIFSICIIAFIIGFGFNCFAKSEVFNIRIAVVDTTAIIEKSHEVQALKTEHEKNLKELKEWLDNVKADIRKQPTEEAQNDLMKKYDDEFAKKQEAMKKKYENKLQAIDKNISDVIAQQAKAQNYDLVLTKSAVLFGGDDITESVIKLIK